MTHEPTNTDPPEPETAIPNLKENVRAALKTDYDPEIPVDIYELGLIYEIQILPLNNVQIEMTLTSPSSPAAQTITVEE